VSALQHKPIQLSDLSVREGAGGSRQGRASLCYGVVHQLDASGEPIRDERTSVERLIGASTPRASRGPRLISSQSQAIEPP
jgi:hypothetical protein